MGENVTSWEALNSWSLLYRLAANEGYVFSLFERNDRIGGQVATPKAADSPSFRMAVSSDSENMRERGSQPVTLLLPLSRTCYTRGARAVAERNASWERRPQQFISRGTFHEWPDAERAIHFCTRWRWPRPGPGLHTNEERSMAGYGGVDYIDFDSQLNDEEKLVRQTARQFGENEIIPIIEKHSREATFPKHLIPQLGELGFFGANLHGYGCAGMSNVAYGLMTQELERGDSGLRSFVSVQGALVMYPIREYGSEDQKQRWLPALQQGKAIGCFGLTEPDFGSNPAGMRTRAVKDGGDYILNGEKAWITSGTIADVALVWARAEDGIRGFLVEKGTPGFTAKDIKGKWSLRASVTSTLALQDVRIPACNVLPNVKGLKGPLSCLNQARYGIGWGAIGAAIACYNESLEYAKVRKQFDDKPIASHQLVQEKFADMIT